MSEDNINNLRGNVNNSEEERESSEEVNLTLTKEKHLIELRRSRVLELWSHGLSQQKIASTLNVSQPLISLDIQYIVETARQEMRTFNERLPAIVIKTSTALESITAMAWNTARSTKDEKIRLQALSLIRDCEKDKLDIVSNVKLVDQFISVIEKRQEQLKEQFLIENENDTGEESTDTDDEERQEE